MNAKQPGMPETTQTVKINVYRYSACTDEIIYLNRNVMKRVKVMDMILHNEYLMVTEDKKMFIVTKLYYDLHIKGDNAFKGAPIPPKARFYKPI